PRRREHERRARGRDLRPGEALRARGPREALGEPLRDRGVEQLDGTLAGSHGSLPMLAWPVSPRRGSWVRPNASSARTPACRRPTFRSPPRNADGAYAASPGSLEFRSRNEREPGEE